MRRDPQIAEIELSIEEAETTRLWCSRLADDPYRSDHAAYDRQIKSRLEELPEKLRLTACSFGEGIGLSGALRVRGLPVPPDLPATPSIPYSEIRIPTGTESLLLGIGSLVGEVLAFQAWRGGDRVHNIYPLPQDAATQKASGSVRLAMHTEAAFRPGAPAALLLLCLRGGDHPPSTGFCDLRPIWGRLDESTRVLLTEEAFAMPGGDPAGTIALEDAQPIVIESDAGPQFQFDTSAIGATPGHNKALEVLRECIEEMATEITFAPGDLVLIDNTHMAHGRTSFTPRYAGSDRWLQRCLISRRSTVIAPRTGAFRAT